MYYLHLIKLASLVDNMYEKFILNDDRMIIKAIRRLIVIYADKLRITKQRVFYNWLGRVFQKKERPNVKDAPEMKCVYKRKIIPLKEEEKSEPSFSLQLNSPKSYQGSSRIEISKADNFEIKKPTVKPHERLYKVIIGLFLLG